jgi:L-fucose mutarotase
VLLNIDPLLSPDLLHALRTMGHRQDLAIVDANFPCDPAGTRTIRLDGVSATDVLAAVLSVLPVEVDEPAGAWRMIADGQPEKILPIFAEFELLVERAAAGRGVTALPPEAFKARAADGFATVITGERRLYGGIIVRKGVVLPPTRESH